MNKRRTFSTEFQHEAACLVLDQNYTIRQAYRSLDVGETAVRRGVRQLREERQGSTPRAKAMTPEQQPIQALEARVQRLKMEKSILKKATAALVSDELSLTR
jgi:transposase